MKYVLVVLLQLAAASLHTVAQPTQPKTYAVIIGISSYENPSIRPLVYAHKDAQLFAQWLQAPAGGSLPDSQLRVLLNERATIAAIYNALDWLKQQCRPGDKAYIYFSGHGDLETANQQQRGYLLAYNTPPNNYPNHAVAVEKLNQDANYLTLERETEVVLVTDACHSGKLAGDFFKGKQWVAQQLQQVLHKEIRLTACAAHEEAAEGEFWGGGRGVFSYYLLKGLYGRAEREKDNRILFAELQQYIDAAFRADEFLRLLKHAQTPLLDGNPQQLLAIVHPHSSDSMQQQTVTMPAPSPLDYFFQQAVHCPLDLFINFKALRSIPRQQLPLHIVQQSIRWQDSMLHLPFYEPSRFGQFANIDSLRLLEQQLSGSAARTQPFIERLAEWAHANVQAMINAFLKGEEAELEKRQYYYSGSRNYGDVLELIETTLALIPAQHHLAAVLQTNEQYIRGLLARMQMAVSRKTDSLLQAAFYHQYQTLALEPYAAYVHNELANLYVHRRQFDSAQYHYSLAAALAPTWAIPWSNQLRMHVMRNNYSLARQALHKADSLQPQLSYVYMNAGVLMEKEQQWLEALSYYRRATVLNNVHYLPFERLAFLYLQTGDYEAANRFFAKALSLKQDFAINDAYFEYGVELGGVPPMFFAMQIDSCLGQLSPESSNMALLLYTLSAAETLPADTVERRLQRILSREPRMPLVHHYLGKRLLEKGAVAAAIPLLQEAIRLYRTDSLLTATAGLFEPNEQLRACIRHYLPAFNYPAIHDYYLLGRAWERLQQPEAALLVYEQATELENELLTQQAQFQNYAREAADSNRPFPPMERLLSRYDMPGKITSVILRMRIHEQLEQYDKAEAVLLQQVVRSRAAGDLRRQSLLQRVPGTWQLLGVRINHFYLQVNSELEIIVHDFYNRMQQRQPRNYYWKQQAAYFLYHRLRLAYIQMPQEQYLSFTNDLANYAYPWQSGQAEFADQTAKWPVPGIPDTIVTTIPAFHPVTTAIRLLEQAQALQPGYQLRASDARMLGDMYNWTGNSFVARGHYIYVLQQQPADTATRGQLVQLLLYMGYYTAAQQQLDTLQQRYTIDEENLNRLIFFHTAARNTNRVTELLGKAPVQHLGDSCRRVLQQANLLLVLGRYTAAIKWLNQRFPVPALHNEAQQNMIQPWLAQRHYMAARCHALLRRRAPALVQLQKAREAGFCGVHVLAQDPAWKRIKRKAPVHLFEVESADAACTGDAGDPVFVSPNFYRIPGEAIFRLQ